MFFSTRVRLLAGSAILVGGLGAAAVNGVFAAPIAGAASGFVAGANTPVAGTPGQILARIPGGGHFGFMGFANQALAGFFGMQLTDLQAALKSHQTLAQIAAAHQKSVADLKTFLTAQEKTRLDGAVQAGKLTAQQETTILNGQSARLDNMINGTFPAGGPGGKGPGGAGRFGHRGGFGGPQIGQIATFMGITPTALQTDLKNGQTLVQVAAAQGKSQADLKAFIVGQESTRIDKFITTNFQQAWAQHRPGASVTPTATP